MPHREWWALREVSKIKATLIGKGWGLSVWYEKIMVDALKNVEFSVLSIPSESPKMAHPICEKRETLLLQEKANLSN